MFGLFYLFVAMLMSLYRFSTHSCPTQDNFILLKMMVIPKLFL